MARATSWLPIFDEMMNIITAIVQDRSGVTTNVAIRRTEPKASRQQTTTFLLSLLGFLTQCYRCVQTLYFVYIQLIVYTSSCKAFGTPPTFPSPLRFLKRSLSGGRLMFDQATNKLSLFPSWAKYIAPNIFPHCSVSQPDIMQSQSRVTATLNLARKKHNKKSIMEN